MKIFLSLFIFSILCVSVLSQIPVGGVTVGTVIFSDSFIRSNGALGSNWTFPSMAPNMGGTLAISSNQIIASGTLPGTHFFEYWNAGTFTSNQFSRTIIGSLPNGICCSGLAADSTGLVVRSTDSNFCNDAVQNFPVTGIVWAIGAANDTDFASMSPFIGTGTYTVGDTVELDAIGNAPGFYVHQHNGVVDGSGIDSTALCPTGGKPGLGIAINSSASPNVIAGAWTGGNLQSQNAGTPSDNFTRANGWLGVNWWYEPNTGAQGYQCAFNVVSNRAASSCTSDAFASAIWTTARGQSQNVGITLGTANVWEGPAVRIEPVTGSYYVTFWYMGSVFLYVNTGGVGGFTALTTLGAIAGPPTNLELDVTGSNPVVLSVKYNGSTFGSPYSDSVFKLVGSYEGFIADGTAVTVAGWSGN